MLYIISLTSPDIFSIVSKLSITVSVLPILTEALIRLISQTIKKVWFWISSEAAPHSRGSLIPKTQKSAVNSHGQCCLWKPYFKHKIGSKFKGNGYNNLGLQLNFAITFRRCGRMLENCFHIALSDKYKECCKLH